MASQARLQMGAPNVKPLRGTRSVAELQSLYVEGAVDKTKLDEFKTNNIALRKPHRRAAADTQATIPAH